VVVRPYQSAGGVVEGRLAQVGDAAHVDLDRVEVLPRTNATPHHRGSLASDGQGRIDARAGGDSPMLRGHPQDGDNRSVWNQGLGDVRHCQL
jgi:hypothetical protein